jgi:hypothetical protein
MIFLTSSIAFERQCECHIPGYVLCTDELLAYKKIIDDFNQNQQELWKEANKKEKRATISIWTEPPIQQQQWQRRERQYRSSTMNMKEEQK